MVDGPPAPAGPAAAHRGRECAAAWLALLVALLASPALAQVRSVPIVGDRLSGFVLPIEPLTGDIDIQARRGWAWRIDDTQRLVLEDDVMIRVGSYQLTGPRAIVWINRLPSADGLINQVAIFFETVGEPTSRAGLGVSGRELLITGSARGEVRVRAVLLERRRPPVTDFQRRAQARLAEHLKVLLVRAPRLSMRPIIERPIPPEEFVPIPGGSVMPADLELPSELQLPAQEAPPWLADPGATLRFSFPGSLEGPEGTDEFAYVVAGGVLVEYITREQDDRFNRLTLSAERAVIFTDPVPLSELPNSQIGLDVIRGVYLEGNVIATADVDTYVVRAPRIYYDFRRGQAIMVDAVLRTYSRSLRTPIYARATEMRQIAANQWEVERVRVSTSEFFTPHLAIGAERMTITQRPDADDEEAPTETYVDSRHNTLRLGDTPVLYWPRLAGRVQDVPLQGVAVGTADNDGVRIETEWNLVTLLGGEKIDGLDARLHLDGYTERGAGAGIKLDFDLDFGSGEIDLYGLFDEGIDRTSAGREVDPVHDFRGVALMEHQADIGRFWLLQTQASYISDETFITSWREDDFLTRREFETSAYLKHQRDNKAFTLLIKDQVTDFISNDYLL
ncbi:MAG: LPS-assembly protein LptD, partial [Planctomycetota bacterium]